VTGITGGGGRHLVYRCATPIPSRPLDGYEGIDVKAEGGMVVVPPSIHPSSGRPYEWEFSWGPGDAEPAEVPPALVELFSTGGHLASGPLDERDEEAVNLLLEHYGGHHPHQRAGYVEVTRPGKEARLGGSGTVGAVGRGVVRVWSTHWPELPAGVYGLGELRRLAGVDGPSVHVPAIEPPPGFRWWHPGDVDRPRPVLGPDAYHGPLGEYLVFLDRRTEAHPAPIGFSILAYLGAWLGRALTFSAGPAIRHHPNLWGAFVGPTSSGAKGVSWGAARLILDTLDRQIVAGHTASGLGSGEALVDMLADDDGRTKAYVVHDHELAAVFRVCQREGSTLSELLRKGFDLDQLESRTRRKGDVIASAYFLAALGSITEAELGDLLDAAAVENGFGNRWLYLWSELTTLLPFGADLDLVRLGAIADRIAEGVAGCIEREYRIADGTPAGDVWRPFYLARRSGRGAGIVRALTARHHVHAARLSILYAALDGAVELGPDHVRAAIAWCDYSYATVELVFGPGASGRARTLVEAIRAAGTNGLDGTAQRDVFHRNLSGEELATIRAELEEVGLVHTEHLPTGGRPRLVSLAITRHDPYDQTTKGTKGPEPPSADDLSSLSSFGRSPLRNGETS
jgi:Bifunctional DNA primase/polymerase, N-terminal